MAGITRINITDAWVRNAERSVLNKLLTPAANQLYTTQFNLADNEVKVRDCKLGSHWANCDTQDGIDLWITKANGAVYSVQEKLLGVERFKTATFTTINHNGTESLWTTCKADIWMTAYGRRTSEGNYDIQDWIMIKLNELREIDKGQTLRWQYSENKTNGEKAKFKFLEFCDVPLECVLYCSDYEKI